MASEDNESGLNFFERHPKKLLAGATAAGVGAYMLTRGKKKPSTSAIHTAIHQAPSHAPAAPKKTPTVKPATPKAVVKAKPEKVTYEEAVARGYPGAKAREKIDHKSDHPGAAHIHGLREEGKRMGMAEHEHRAVTTARDLNAWKKARGKAAISKTSAVTLLGFFSEIESISRGV